MPWLCLVLSEWQSQWAILFHWGLPWTSPWPCHGIAKCPSDWPPHGPGYSMGPFIGNHPWPCHGIDLDFLVGHPMAQALPWRCSLPFMPMPWHSLVLSDWPSHGPGYSMGPSLATTHGHAMALIWTFLIGHPMAQAPPWRCSLPLSMPWHSLVLSDLPSHGQSPSIGLVLAPPMAMPLDCLVLSDWPSHGAGSSMGLALPPIHTHGHAMALPGAF